MKNILKQTIFFSLCLLGGVTYGQTGYLYHNNIDGFQSMIRYHNASGKNVTYSWDASMTKNHFALSDMSTMIDAHVANGYFVHDFEILGNYAFFCGENASSSGFLGWFDINDVFNAWGMVGHVYIDETLSAYGIENLDNIEVYYDKLERIHIAGVGQHIVSGIPVGFKAFEAVGYVPTSMQYKVADLYGGNPIPMPKLAVTDDYVVYETPTYTVYGSGIGFNLEPFPRDDMFVLPTHPVYLFQTAYGGGVYPDATDPYSWNVSITHKKENTIAICNYRQGIDSIDSIGPFIRCHYDNNYLFVLREYDLSPLLLGNPIQMITDSRVKLPLGVGELRKLVYDPLTKHYLVLFNNETSLGFQEDGIMTLDYSSGAAPPMARTTYQQAYPNGHLWDMCLVGGTKYTASGFGSPYLNYYFWHDDIFSNAPNCANYIDYYVDPKDPEVVKEMDCVSNVVGWIGLNFLPNMEVELQNKDNVLDCN